jgi:hypothetical protein
MWQTETVEKENSQTYRIKGLFQFVFGKGRRIRGMYFVTRFLIIHGKANACLAAGGDLTLEGRKGLRLFRRRCRFRRVHGALRGRLAAQPWPGANSLHGGNDHCNLFGICQFVGMSQFDSQ